MEVRPLSASGKVPGGASRGRRAPLEHADLSADDGSARTRVALDLSSVFRHHVPKPPAPPITLPAGVQNPFMSPLPTTRALSARPLRASSSGMSARKQQRPETARPGPRSTQMATPLTHGRELEEEAEAGTLLRLEGQEMPTTQRHLSRFRPGLRSDPDYETQVRQSLRPETALSRPVATPRGGRAKTAGRPKTARILRTAVAGPDDGFEWPTSDADDTHLGHKSAVKVFMRNNRYTSRPISRVETCGSLLPPSVDHAVLEQHLGATELRINRMKHAKIERPEKEEQMLKEFEEMKKAIARGEPIQAQSNGLRVGSPVDWSQLEPVSAMAKGEKLGSAKDQSMTTLASKNNGSHRKQSRAEADRRSSKRPQTAHTRPSKGKFEKLFPPPPNSLRPETASKCAKMSVKREKNPPKARLAYNQRNIAGLAGDHEGTHRHPDGDAVGVFLTQTNLVDPARQEKQGHVQYVEPTKPKFHHLNPKHVYDFIQALPTACEGRLLLNADVKTVLSKRETGLKKRVVEATKKPALSADQNKVQQNCNHVRTAQEKMKIIHDHAERISWRIAATTQRRTKIHQEEIAKTEHTIRSRLERVENFKAQGELLQRTDLQRHLLALMAFAFKTSRVFHKMQRWRDYRPYLQRQRWAVLLIEKHYQRHKSRQFSKRAAEALFTLAVVFSKCIRNWKKRYRQRKTDQIITYLREQKSAASLQVAVNRFRIKVVRAQKRVRQVLAINAARYELLEMQWNRIDEERCASFEERRDAILTSLHQKIKPLLELKGGERAALNARMRIIESYAGVKKKLECTHDLEKRRRKYCEYFLPAELQEVQKVSEIIKKRMLEMYVKKSRQKYTHEWEEYKEKTKTWQNLRQNQQVFKNVALDLVQSFGGGQGSKYLETELAKFAQKLEKPTPPPTRIVLPRAVMEQMIQRAVDHSMRIRKGSAQPANKNMMGVSIAGDTIAS